MSRITIAAGLGAALVLASCGGAPQSSDRDAGVDSIASAVKPEPVERAYFDTWTFPDPANLEEFPQVCSFRYQVEITETIFGERFYDQEGTRVGAILHYVDVNKHRNLDSGLELVESLSYTANRDLLTGEQMVTGQTWSLHTPDGQLVYSGAGRYVTNLTGEELYDTTPHTRMDLPFLEIICPLLGGTVAE